MAWIETEIDNAISSVGSVTGYTGDSIVLGSDNLPHICYYDDTAGNLWYAKFDGSVWNKELVDSTDDVGIGCSITLNSVDIPFISYLNNTTKVLRVAHRLGGSWLAQTAYDESGWELSSSTSIQINKNTGKLWVGFTAKNTLAAFPTPWLIVAFNVSGAWGFDIEDSGGICSDVRGTIDSNNNPKFVYQRRNGSSSRCRYAFYNGVDYNNKGNINGSTGTSRASIAVDSNDILHVIYADTNSDPSYSTYDGSWTHVDEGFFGKSITHTSIAIDKNDVPHIVIQDLGSTDIQYSNRVGGSWSTFEVVDSNNWESPSIAIDLGLNKQIISYGSLWGYVEQSFPAINTFTTSTLGTDFINIDVQINYAGTMYAIAVPAGDTAPTSIQVKAGQDSTNTPVASGFYQTIVLTALENNSISFTNLANNTSYDIYTVTENVDLQDIPTIINESTVASVPTGWVKVADELAGVPRIKKLVSHTDGSLYGTDIDSDLVRWTGTAWELKASSVFTSTGLLHSFNSKLFTIALGKIYEWDDVSAWSAVTTTDIFGPGFSAITDFEGNIYAGPDALYESVGGTAEFTLVAPSIGSSYKKLIVFDSGSGSKIYMGTTVGELYEWSGVAWILKAPANPGADIISDMVVFNNELYVLYENSGKLLKWDNSTAFIPINTIDVNVSAHSLLVFDNAIYMSGDNSSLWKLVGTEFVFVNNLSPDVGRILTMTSHNSRIYGAGI